MIDPDRFKDELAILSEFYGREFSEPTGQRFYDILSGKHDLTTEEFVQACAQVVEECEFFPRMGVFVRYAMDYRRRKAFQPVRREAERKNVEAKKKIAAEAESLSASDRRDLIEKAKTGQLAGDVPQLPNGKGSDESA